jgi:hypothetical protein
VCLRAEEVTDANQVTQVVNRLTPCDLDHARLVLRLW